MSPEKQVKSLSATPGNRIKPKPKAVISSKK